MYFVGLIAGAIIGIWGANTRGTWSRGMEAIGGLLWFASAVVIAFSTGLVTGVVAVFASFVIAAIVKNLVPRHH